MRSAHALGMLGTFSPPLRVSDPDMHHGTCVTHVPWCMPGSLTSDSCWGRLRGRRFRHSRRMRSSQFYVAELARGQCVHFGKHHQVLKVSVQILQNAYSAQCFPIRQSVYLPLMASRNGFVFHGALTCDNIWHYSDVTRRVSWQDVGSRWVCCHAC